MKNFTLLMAAAAIAVAPAFAGPSVAKVPRVHNTQQIVKTERHQTPVQGLREFNGKALDLSSLKANNSVRKSRSFEDVIWWAEGEATDYMCSSTGFTVFFGSLFFEPEQNLKEIVWGEGGAVYFKNLINVGLDTYVKGQYEDGKITVEFPQTVYYGIEEYEGEDGETVVEEYQYYLTVLEYNEDENWYFNAAADKCTVTYIVEDDGSLTLDLNPDYDYAAFEEEGIVPQYLIGVVGDPTPGADAWYGYGDALQSYEKFDMEVAQFPEDAEIEKWAFKSTDDSKNLTAHFVDVAVSGDKVYVAGICEDLPEGCVVGTINGDKVSFETGQYMGYFDYYGMPFFFVPGTVEFAWDEDYEEWYVNDYELTDAIVFNYDAEAMTLTPVDENAFIAVNAKTDDLYYLELYVDPAFNFQTPEMCNAKPLNPSVIGFAPYEEHTWGWQGSITWNIPMINVKGAILDTEKMYYNFLVDGEIYGIDPEEFTKVEEYMEDIPYDYTEDWDFYVAGELHQIYYSFDGAESFGLQSFYVGDDGVTYASDVITYATTGVKAIESSDMVSCKYFDMTGRQIARPESGIYVKVMNYADGTSRTVKVRVK